MSQELTAGTTISLSVGGLSLTVSPSIGGSISSFSWIDDTISRPLLRECHTSLENVLDAASFPLVPYVNRIRGGRFTFRGREIRLRPNMAGDPNPLHGQGWMSAWEVEAASEAEALLS